MACEINILLHLSQLKVDWSHSLSVAFLELLSIIFTVWFGREEDEKILDKDFCTVFGSGFVGTDGESFWFKDSGSTSPADVIDCRVEARVVLLDFTGELDLVGLSSDSNFRTRIKPRDSSSSSEPELTSDAGAEGTQSMSLVSPSSKDDFGFDVLELFFLVLYFPLDGS